MSKVTIHGMVGIVMAAASLSAAATENGNTQYGVGGAQFYAGAAPPFPGIYVLSQTSYYSADRLNDGNGNKVPIDFKVSAFVETIRVVGVTGIGVAGGTLYWQAIFPIVADMNVRAANSSDHRGGLADTTLSPGVQWQFGNHHVMAGLDVGVPTGQYNAEHLANPGLNHWSLQPAFGYHYLNFANPRWEFGLCARYIVNFKNSATDYRSGNELELDYAAGYNFGPFRAGVTGYALQQVNNDTGPTAPTDGYRGRALAVGPSLNWRLGKTTEISVAYHREFMVENRASGNFVWLNFATKL